MSNDLNGKVALVTGGSRGIGAAVAIQLARQGADVALTYQRSADAAANVVDEIKAVGNRALAIQADSAEAGELTGAVEQVVGEFGRLDILVNNAGVGVLGPLQEIALPDVDHAIAVNVRAPFVAAQAAAPHMADGGRIISIGSCVGERTPFPGMTLYALSKTGLAGMTKGLAKELGPRGITANLVHPGPTDTDMNPAHGQMAAAQQAETALGSYGHPEDVAAMVAHLAGPGGRYVTGANIAVDGGWAA